MTFISGCGVAYKDRYTQMETKTKMIVG